MIEAYEIGIRLALDDGVSAGVDAIKRELAELNRQVDASLGHLAGLRLAAVAVTAPSAPEQQAPRPTQAQTPELAETAVSPSAPAPDREPSAAPDNAGPPSPLDGQPQQRTAALVAATDNIPDAVLRFEAPAAPTERPAASDPPPEARQEAKPSAPAEPARAPPAQGASAQGEAPPISTPPRPPDARRSAPPAPAPAERTVSAALRIAAAPQAASPRAAAVQTGAEAAAPMRPRPPPAAESPPELSVAFAADSPLAVPVAPSRSSTASAHGGAGTRRAGAAAPEGAPSQGPMDVHVYLDGFPLGRWMADHLGRAASRPPASSAAFDPRVSPAWPGAPVA